MAIADIIIGSLILLACVRGFFNGFLSEFMSLVGCVLCFVLVVAFANPVAQLFPEHGLNDQMRYLVSFAALLLFGLIAWGLIQKQILESVRDRGISAVDSLLGGALGAVFGGVVCIFGLMLVHAIFPASSLWLQDSVIAPKLMAFEPLVRDLMKFLWQLIG